MKIEKRIAQQDLQHKKALAEAGSAITDTLKIAFDNLKKNTADHNKLNAKLTEHNSRLHRLEQHITRTTQSFQKNKESIEEFDKNSLKNQKEKSVT